MSNILYAIQAAIKAGQEILKIYDDPNADFSIEKKADQSPLTIADRISHNVISEWLRQTNIPVLSEEGKDIPYAERSQWKQFWLVDPIDGTKEFIKKNGEFTVNIALIENNLPIAGVIYVPVKEDLYWGLVGQGAWKIKTNQLPESLDELTQQAQQLPIEQSRTNYRVVGSRSFMTAETENFINQLRIQYPDLEIVSKGSSLKICMVAEGEADIYPRFGPTMEWDTAAGQALAMAAGKQVNLTDKQTPLSYNKENLLNPFFIVHQ